MDFFPKWDPVRLNKGKNCHLDFAIRKENEILLLNFDIFDIPLGHVSFPFSLINESSSISLYVTKKPFSNPSRGTLVL